MIKKITTYLIIVFLIFLFTNSVTITSFQNNAETMQEKDNNFIFNYTQNNCFGFISKVKPSLNI